MNSREVAAEYRLASWAQAMQERVSNGESIKDFCQNRGIGRNTYFYWQRRLREAACRHLAMSGPTAQPKQPAPTFTEVRMLEAATAESATPVDYNKGQLRAEISGVVITADSGYPADQLAVLLRALTRPC